MYAIRVCRRTDRADGDEMKYQSRVRQHATGVCDGVFTVTFFFFAFPSFNEKRVGLRKKRHDLCFALRPSEIAGKIQRPKKDTSLFETV